MNFSNFTILIVFIGFIGLALALTIYFLVKKAPTGTDKMNYLSEIIHAGSMVFLRREYSIILVYIVVLFFILWKLFSIYTSLSFLTGAVCSMLAGFIGLKASTRSAVRTTQAAISGGMPEALEMALKGGSVMGLSVASLGIIGLGIFFFFFKDPKIINGFAMGASSIALFARVGGGIFTKSADVGADLVGKVEARIPEDDPRNPGVIADNVGDNVGDTAGMGADLFESYVGSIVATMAIGATFIKSTLEFMILPLLLVTIGLLSSTMGVFSIYFLKRVRPQSALRNATYISGVLFIIGSYFAINSVTDNIKLYWAVLAGLIAGVLIGLESEFFTSGPPIKSIAKSALSGKATVIITGFAVGFESTVFPLLTIVLAVFLAYKFGGLYGISLSAVGMLSIIGIVMSTDSYGPIADNAGGIAEMSGAGEEIRKITDELDATGNTTAAIGKGFAIGSAALTALALFSAYQKTVGLSSINLTEVDTVMGLLIGALMPFIITALTMKSVGKTANKMVQEIRRQFREIKGLLDGKAEPDYKTCIDIVTKGALLEMALPGSIAIIVPITIGLLLGPQALGGFLAGAISTGVLLGLFMVNAGAAWDNAKKLIEKGMYGGKGSESHAAAVVGDTVGDPLKDTAGPSMNILIKLMTVVSLVFAPLLL
ncbi:sodium-translocating pyrophosphatase [SCandidatus Aminicenantes bacterium Aminicenantia_JdfR_composite]|jgi:K(+)-stimulated pyrophosphate-energized sodium pump|nr:sodium-translocating pyrophosphatase [SCandidatus Aminicenantes bacterium Aminicenantia_JdfR_composite]MCP2605664.1 sodium-translocating pyrophosphatase [Candidatus Aminicenantes bacterium AC-335-O07]MCP2620556.1 sodium-translocating pyrophosphatase [Candidatus Aminicenantes bacterium AC-334-E05]